jgi:hypothetical protein
MTSHDTKIRALLDELAGEARLDPGLEPRTLRRARGRRVAGALATAAVVVGVLAGGLVAARELTPRSLPAGGGATPSPTLEGRSPGPTSTPSPRPEATPSEAAPSPAFDTDLEDGRHIAYLKRVGERTDPVSLRFDLAIFLTGDEANEYAAAHGLEVPVPNDNLIVNDNPRLRLMPLAPDVEIRVIDYPDGCCEANEALDLDAFAALLRVGGPLADGSHAGRFAPYWLTIRGGTIVAIEEQYTP